MHAKSLLFVSNSLQPHGLKLTRLNGILRGNNTGVGCHALLQGIFLTQGLNLPPAAPALQVDFLLLSHQGN